MGATMKAVVYDEFGGPEVLRIADLPRPEPAAGEVLLEVAAASVNPIDRRLRSGELADFFEYSWPVIPGWDVAGRIVAVGQDVTDWQVGDAVCGLGFNWKVGVGSYAEFMPIDAGFIAHKPDRLSFVEAAALPLVSLTSWQALTEIGKVGSGTRAFIQAGAGGIGSVATAMAKHLGAEVFTTTRETNFAYVRARGADHPIDYTQTDYVAEIARLAPGGVDFVLETLESDEHIGNAIRVTNDGGTVVYMNNEPPEMPDLSTRNIHAEWLHHRADGAMLAELMTLFDAGTLPLPEIHTMAFADAVEAHKQSESWRTRGKLVLTVADL